MSNKLKIQRRTIMQGSKSQAYLPLWQRE